jgi:hypothetical protein
MTMERGSNAWYMFGPVLIALAMLLASCTSTESMVEAPGGESIRAGMSAEEVTEVMGEPDNVLQTYDIHNAGSPGIPAPRLYEYHYDGEDGGKPYHIYIDTNDSVAAIARD